MPAGITTQCYELTSAINSVRLADIDAHRFTFPVLHSLEKTNQGNGIGFVFFGSLGLPVILSTSTLLSISAIIFSYFVSQDLVAQYLDPSTWVVAANAADASLPGQCIPTAEHLSAMQQQISDMTLSHGTKEDNAELEECELYSHALEALKRHTAGE